MSRGKRRTGQSWGTRHELPEILPRGVTQDAPDSSATSPDSTCDMLPMREAHERLRTQSCSWGLLCRPPLPGPCQPSRLPEGKPVFRANRVVCTNSSGTGSWSCYQFGSDRNTPSSHTPVKGLTTILRQADPSQDSRQVRCVRVRFGFRHTPSPLPRHSYTAPFSILVSRTWRLELSPSASWRTAGQAGCPSAHGDM